MTNRVFVFTYKLIMADKIIHTLYGLHLFKALKKIL